MNNNLELISTHKKSFVKQLSNYHIKFLTPIEQKICKKYGLNDKIPIALCFAESFELNMIHIRNNRNAIIYLCYGNNIFGYKLIDSFIKLYNFEVDYLQFCFYYPIYNKFCSARITDININTKKMLYKKIISKFMELLFLFKEIANTFEIIDDIKKHIILSIL